MTHIYQSVCFTIVVLVLSGCAAHSPNEGERRAVTIMTFNVENLFDTRHDVGKNDHTYLPAALKDAPEHRARCARIAVPKWRSQCEDWDWNDAILATKLERLAGVILANQKDGADIIVFQEVENRSVLEALRRDYLGGAGYGPVVLLEGADERGIDVAFMSRLPVVGEPRLHPARFTDIDPQRAKDTRGILEATFRLPDGSVITGFAVHFPAPYHPAELRVQSYRFLDSLVARLPAGRSYFAAGDFNTIASEGPIIDKYVEPSWLVAHRLGCSSCRGTYYYAPNDDWSFLDMILLSKDLAPGSGGWALAPDRTRVAIDYPPQVTQGGTPASFDLPEPSGVSDHWPLLVELRLGAP